MDLSAVFLFQRIGQSLRQGGHADVQLEIFEEALHDSSGGLTSVVFATVS